MLYRTLLLAGCAWIAGCDVALDVTPGAAGFQRDFKEQLFDSAIGLVSGHDELATSDSLTQVVNRLNQWIDNRAASAWQADSLVATLPEALQKTPLYEALGELRFRSDDAYSLQEAVWLREIGRQAVGRELDTLLRAQLLFDWTVRHIQLDAATSEKSSPRLPWHVLLLGHGTPEERAWVFLLLARQQDIEGVLLTPRLDAAEPGGATQPSPATAPLVALLIDNELYLFDPLWGLPIPRADGQGVATLDEACDDLAVLAQMSVETEQPYRWQPEQLRTAVAWIEASPVYVARRMQLVESRLAGPQRLVLSTDPGALAERVKRASSLPVQLWPRPWERWQPNTAAERARLQAELQPFTALKGDVLGHARVAHLLGHFTGERGALRRYMTCRPAEEQLAEVRQAGRLTPEVDRDVRTVKQCASYWLGLLSFERGNFDAALDYFTERTLAASPDGPWTEGARYNLGRTYEALGQRTAAARAYQSTTGAQRPGNLLRAARQRVVNDAAKGT